MKNIVLKYCSKHGIALAKRNFTLKYDTNVPRQVSHMFYSTGSPNAKCFFFSNGCEGQKNASQIQFEGYPEELR